MRLESLAVLKSEELPGRLQGWACQCKGARTIKEKPESSPKPKEVKGEDLDLIFGVDGGISRWEKRESASSPSVINIEIVDCTPNADSGVKYPHNYKDL